MTIVFNTRHLDSVKTSQCFDMILVPERFDSCYLTLSGDFDILAIIS